MNLKVKMTWTRATLSASCVKLNWILWKHDKYQKPCYAIPPGAGRKPAWRPSNKRRQSFPLTRKRAKQVKMSTSTFTAKDLWPYSVLENQSFALWARIQHPYNETKNEAMESLEKPVGYRAAKISRLDTIMLTIKIIVCGSPSRIALACDAWASNKLESSVL